MDFQPVQSRVHPGGGGSGTQELLEGKRRTVKMEEEEGSPSIKLGLGIDRKTSKVTPVRKHGKCVFTTTQLHELRLQTLIFKYIAGGIQVPVSLVLSIWKSVAFSVGVYQRYPSFGVSPQAFDYRNMVDPEPGRCRRTDGKKWRCSKDVIPYQKYCLQHMHRGCRRSRKPVETTSQTALPDLTSSGISIKLSKNSKNHSAPVCSQYMNQSSCNTSSSHETPDIAAIGSDNICSNRKYVTANASTSTITATKKTGENDSKRIKSEQYEEKPSVSDGTTINRSCKCVNKVTVAHNISPTVGFSPKSVLQVLGNSSSRVYKNKIEVEPGRCRRTDGKRWRCSRDVVPDQKYCVRHMHRGARKHAEVLQPVAVPTNGDSRPSGLTIANKATCPAPSTSLSISIPSHLPTTLDEKSMSSSSETTISDTTVTVFDNGKFS
ncbi:LOW QUALITY PROTEIN: growth-regulating factor 9-like [Hibiscus syriacus]|uniref:LOW QUALITY PROTEIN: growth-regulating factor 9-like n=1 Tax=Hibiscus syriacus TaxID=106335 RepID=UPI0019222512|nr:LOW QUALITY PROTEIN: growth-regulating factor 9-like [Hibiscus syriacus]